MTSLYKFTVGRHGCSVCGGLPGGRHEPDCDATEELRAAIAEEREACARVAEAHFPRGGAHTYASENADRYLAVEDAAEAIAAAIRARV